MGKTAPLSSSYTDITLKLQGMVGGGSALEDWQRGACSSLSIPAWWSELKTATARSARPGTSPLMCHQPSLIVL